MSSIRFSYLNPGSKKRRIDKNQMLSAFGFFYQAPFLFIPFFSEQMVSWLLVKFNLL